MSVRVRADGWVIIVCAGCRHFLQQDERRSSLPLESSLRYDVEEAYRDADAGAAIAMKHGWRRRGTRWSCPGCEPLPPSSGTRSF